MHFIRFTIIWKSWLDKMKKKSITVWAFEKGVSGDYDLEIIDKQLRSAGFNALELSFSDHGTISFDTDINKLKSDYKKLRLNGIEFSSISTLLFDKVNIVSNDEAEREYAIKIVKKMVDIASELKIKTISISPGKVVSNSNYSLQLERALENIRLCGVYAQTKDVYLCIENVWGAILVSPYDFSYFLDKVDNDYVRMCLDIGNTLMCGYPNHWFEVLGRKIKKVHYTDVKRRKNLFLEFVTPGRGNVDWKHLKEYEDFLDTEYSTVEFFYDNIRNYDSWLKECASELDKIERL